MWVTRHARHRPPRVSGGGAGEAGTWLALRAVTRTARLAGRDLGRSTFGWAGYAVAVYDAWDAVTTVIDPPADLAVNTGIAPPGRDSLSLRWSVMRLSCAVAAAFAAAAAGEPGQARRAAFTRAAARLTEAAARLRSGWRPRRRGGGTAAPHRHLSRHPARLSGDGTRRAGTGRRDGW